MKFIAAYILLLSLVFQTFGGYLVSVRFRAFQEKIAEKLCVNRARPVMKCLGKCQLQKKLENKQSQSGATSQESNTHPELFCSESDEQYITCPKMLISKRLYTPVPHISSVYLSSPVKPPAFNVS